MRRILRRLRGALGHAVVWGASWFGVMLTVLTTGTLAGVIQVASPWSFVFFVALNAGVTGFLTGAAFAAYLGFAYRDRSLLDLRLPRVALAGGAVAVMFSAGFGLLMRASASLGIVLGDLVTGGMWATALGAVTAAGSVHVAQRATRHVTAAATAELDEEQRQALALLETGST